MHVRCNYCNQSFNLSREFVEDALEKSEEKGQKYYGVECFNCRKLVKIPVQQMRHFTRPIADVTGDED